MLATEFDAETGRGRVIGYPVMRPDRRLTIGLRGAAPVEVDLP